MTDLLNDDFEQDLTALLAARADRIEVQPDLDGLLGSTDGSTTVLVSEAVGRGSRPEPRRGIRALPGRGWSVAAAAAVLLAAAATVGALAGGVVDNPLTSFSDAASDGSAATTDDETRFVISPYVRLADRQVDQTDEILFTVRADQPSYWRVAALDDYGDQIWRLTGDFEPEPATLNDGERGGTRRVVSQWFEIEALDAIWLPVAPDPIGLGRISGASGWTASDDGSSLAVPNDVPTSDGYRYAATSAVPDFTAEELRATTAVPPVSAAELAGTEELSDLAREIARAVTEEAATDYDRALALQDHFRSFTLVTEATVPAPGEPIDQLFVTDEGTNQQIAGMFALLARDLGMTARVSVGYTWGDPEIDDGDVVYRVSGRHAHAWPEVYFEGIGWVPFEPTPGRGIPNAMAYTGVPAVQNSGVQPILTTDLTPGTLVLWLDPDLNPSEFPAIRSWIDDRSEITAAVYIGKPASWADFVNHYRGQPEVIDLVDPDQLPTSFVIEVAAGTDIDALAREAAAIPGVQELTTVVEESD